LAYAHIPTLSITWKTGIKFQLFNPNPTKTYRRKRINVGGEPVSRRHASVQVAVGPRLSKTSPEVALEVAFKALA